MKTSKYLVFGLSLALALSLVSCGGQQSGQEPQKPEQEVQQTEQVSTPPAVEPMEVKQEAEPPAAPTEPVVLNEVDTTGEAEDAGANEPAETMQLFDDCNETAYATGAVNIRASYTADSDKLGSLSVGEGVTRTGTSIAGTEAEGWSRVQLSDGTTAYVSNNYLSATQPVTQQQQSSGGSQQTQQTQSGGSQQQTQQPTSSTKKIDGHDDLGDYVLNGQGGKYYPALGITLPVSYDGTTTNGAPPQTAEEQEAAKATHEAGLESSRWHTESWANVSMGG